MLARQGASDGNNASCFYIDNFDLKVRVILDWYEVMIDRPSSYLQIAETWSHYKHHNAGKFLFGISPQNAVTFLSRAFGGRASDKFITKESAVLNLLEYLDVVLAKRGSLITESVGMCHATFIMPALTKGEKN